MIFALPFGQVQPGQFPLLTTKGQRCLLLSLSVGNGGQNTIWAKICVSLSLVVCKGLDQPS